jgi:hypothetical protein
MKNYVYYHFWKVQLIWFHKMRDLVTFLKSPQIGTRIQNDLQISFKNSKPLEILWDTLNICLPHLLKILALLMMITKSYQFQKKDFKTKAKTLDIWICFNTYPNGVKFIPHMKSFMIYKIAKLQIQKRSKKWYMIKNQIWHKVFQKAHSFHKTCLFLLKI